MASTNQGLSLLTSGQLKIDPAKGVTGIPSTAYGRYGGGCISSSPIGDRGATLRVGQNKIAPANGTGKPSTAYGNSGGAGTTTLGGRDDLGATFQGKSPAPSGFTVPTPLAVPKSKKYLMRRTDTGISTGYVFWTNTMGDATGAPAPVGSVGSPVILDTFFS